MAPNLRVNSKSVETPDYIFETPPSNLTDAEQTGLKRDNDDVQLALLKRGPQVPRLGANAAEFQPSERHDPSGYGDTSFAASPDYYMVPGEPGTVPGAQGNTEPTRLVGDMVAGMPKDGYATQDTPVDLGADLATGGEPDGPKSANRPGPQDFFRSIKDYPDGKGAGNVPLQPGAQLGE